MSASDQITQVRSTHNSVTTARPDATLPIPAVEDFAPNLALPWVIRLRYGMAAGEAAIILATVYAFALPTSVLWGLAPLVLILGSNILLGMASEKFSRQSLGAVFCLDTLCLTVMLGLTGGPMNPFSLLYLVQITLSAMVLPKLWTWALGALSTVCFGLLFAYHLPLAILEPHHMEPGWPPHLVGMWLAFLIAAILITFFTGKVSDALRSREQQVLMLHQQVAKNQRLASLMTLAAGAAHELGTPLGTIAIVAKELERYASKLTTNETILDDARLIRAEVERCRVILERMSIEGAEPVGEAPRRIVIKDLLQKVVHRFPESQQTALVIEADTRLEAILPQQATVQAIAALVQNALDADQGSPNIPSPVILTAVQAGSQVDISVHDHGSGMSSEVLQHIAEPFFTTKEPGRGMGLGTFLVRTFAERLGGQLSFESTPAQGTIATLRLPVNPTKRPNERSSQ